MLHRQIFSYCNGEIMVQFHTEKGPQWLGHNMCYICLEPIFFLLNLIQNAFVNCCGVLQEAGLVKTGFINFDIRGFSEWEEPESKQSNQHFILFTF